MGQKGKRPPTPGAPGSGRQAPGLMGTELVWEDEKVLERDGGTTMWKYLMPLDRTLPNGYDGNFTLCTV